MFTTSRSITCPYCWEAIDIVVDLSVPEQEYTEDCYVCCRPIVIRYASDAGTLTELSVTPEQE